LLGDGILLVSQLIKIECLFAWTPLIEATLRLLGVAYEVRENICNVCGGGGGGLRRGLLSRVGDGRHYLGQVLVNAWFLPCRAVLLLLLLFGNGQLGREVR
jgi:hypothetical protein